jgi:hypothetical protein
MIAPHSMSATTVQGGHHQRSERDANTHADREKFGAGHGIDPA